MGRIEKDEKETLRLDIGENRHQSNLSRRKPRPYGQGRAAVTLSRERRLIRARDEKRVLG